MEDHWTGVDTIHPKTISSDAKTSNRDSEEQSYAVKQVAERDDQWTPGHRFSLRRNGR